MTRDETMQDFKDYPRWVSGYGGSKLCSQTKDDLSDLLGKIPRSAD